LNQQPKNVQAEALSQRPRRNMQNESNNGLVTRLWQNLFRVNAPLLLAGAFLIGAVALTGCKSSDTANYNSMTAQAAAAGVTPATEKDKVILREGDTVRLNFPGAPNLNAVQPIRRDGKLALALVGEVQAAGLTPADLEKKLLELYGPQLQTKELTVTLESSAFTVYVTGAVLHPGKVVADHPLNALEAVMEAGGFDNTKANLKSIRVIRNEGGKTEHFTLNLKDYMQGKTTEIFRLKPSDILFVPERFAWF
jgi:polysaccharide export outer membrane protein